MFANYLYCLIALLIFSTYQFTDKIYYSITESILIYIGSVIAYTCIAILGFKKIEERAIIDSFESVDYKINKIETLLSLSALLFFGTLVYWLNFPSIIKGVYIFSLFPTLLGLMFLIVFILYLVIMWSVAHTTRKRIFKTEISYRDYIYSNVSFPLTILIFFIILSGIPDVINILPFKLLKDFFSSLAGSIIYFFVSIFMVIIFGPVIIQKIWGCKPLEEGHVLYRIQNLCDKAGIKYSRILIWPILGGNLITAGVMGLIGKFRFILITPALLRFLDPDELDSVIAHEIGHVKKKHLIFYAFFMLSFIFILFFNIQIISSFINFNTFFQWIPDSYKAFINGMVLIISIIIFIRYIFGYIMRNFERQADLFVYTLLKNAHPMIRTFNKIATINRMPKDKPNWHHFSIKERIDYLKKCEIDKSYIVRHNIKIRRIVSIYIIIVAIFATGISYTLFYTDLKNPGVYNAAYGDYYYSKKMYEKAIESYEKALQINPDYPHVLNNMAWLFATCEDKSFFNLEKALIYAKKATNFDRTSQVLDTLAESYFINGKTDEAIRIEKEAIMLAKDKDFYYKKQLDRFLNFKKNSH